MIHHSRIVLQTLVERRNAERRLEAENERFRLLCQQEREGRHLMQRPVGRIVGWLLGVALGRPIADRPTVLPEMAAGFQSALKPQQGADSAHVASMRHCDDASSGRSGDVCIYR